MPRRMRKNNGIRNNYIFRLGKLHAIFATLEVFGKYTENSGLDRLYIETGIYGESTLRQTINGKHMKRRAVEVGLTRQNAERVSVFLATINNTLY